LTPQNILIVYLLNRYWYIISSLFPHLSLSFLLPSPSPSSPAHTRFTAILEVSSACTNLEIFVAKLLISSMRAGYLGGIGLSTGNIWQYLIMYQREKRREGGRREGVKEGRREGGKEGRREGGKEGKRGGEEGRSEGVKE
jgi:hypothetical protein